MYAIFKQELFKKAQETYRLHNDFYSGKIDLNQLQHYQNISLKEVLKYVISESGFYRKKFSELTNSNIDGFSVHEIQKLPFTTKDDLRSNSSTIASAPLYKSWIYYETTGTTGSPTPCPRNEIDSIYNNTPLIINYRNIFEQQGNHHIVGVMGPSELHSTGDTFEDVLRSLGHTVVKMWPRSPVVGMKRVVALINELKITALVCTPAVAISIARHIKDLGQNPAQSSISLILTVGELITPALLRNLGQVWGAQAFSCMYASQESSILAVCHADSHLYTIPLNCYYEIIDPISEKNFDTTGSLVTGELVITHLYLGQKPLIRYRTGDMVRSSFMPNGSQMIVPIGRVRDVLKLNNTPYCAWDLESALLDKLNGCLDYAIQIEKINNVDTLNITIEMFDDYADTPTVFNNVKEYMQQKLPGVQVNLKRGETAAVTGTSAMVSWKAARLHDLRPEADNSDRDAALALINRGFK